VVRGSGGGLEGDVVAERFELFDEPTGSVFERMPSGEPVGAELPVGDPVANDVVVGGEDVVPDAADRFGVAAAPTELPVVGCEVGALGMDGGVRGLGERGAQPGVAVPGLSGAAFAA
jgi:hypothetical protein